ncbi:LysR family transcriptional regulator [Oxalobacteraceae bacterium]|nr:LysR family transcriptional regulator [Oxalobacteraceae bacterium]
MDIRGADLPLLVSLDVLLEEKNVTRAAARLHLSQPALSAQLARLRDLMGDPLLVPSERSRGMVATARALSMQAPLREALAALGMAVAPDASAFDPASAKRVFRIAGNDNAIMITMMELISAIGSQGGPDLKVAFVTPDMERLVEQMERGEIDLVVGGSEFLPPQLLAQTVCTVKYRMGQRKGHPRGRRKPTLAAYCKLRHIIVSNEAGFHGFMDDVLAQHGCKREVAVSVAHYSVVPAMLANSDLVCSLPAAFLERYSEQLDIVDLPVEAGEFGVSIGWHRRSDNDPAHRWLRAQFASV